MSTIAHPPAAGGPAAASAPEAVARRAPHTLLAHLATSALYTVVTVIAFGFIYPFAITALASVLFAHQAAGSYVMRDGKPVGSEIVGQPFTSPRDFAGRPSAAGKNGYDPTATGGTNLGPTSKKLIDATRAAIAALRKANPDAVGVPPIDLITSSGSGIDPDISPEAAYYEAPRVAKARGVPLERVRSLVARHVRGRTLGIFGEPRVNVLELNLALDTLRPA